MAAMFIYDVPYMKETVGTVNPILSLGPMRNGDEIAPLTWALI